MATSTSQSTNIRWHGGEVTPALRRQVLGHGGATLWLTGLSGSGKSTIAVALERELLARGVLAYRLDGDNLRHGLCADLGFAETDRAENVRRAGEAAKLLADSGTIAVVSLISPFVADREAVRKSHAAGGLPCLEVFADTPLAECEKRDVKGLYAKARRGEIPLFTGISSPYEPPTAPDLHLRPAEQSVDECVAACLDLLRERGIVSNQA